MRGSARKQARNHSIKSRLHTFENKLLATVKAGNKTEAVTALNAANSAFDKAVKAGTITRAMANRKKSRLALRVSKLKA